MIKKSLSDSDVLVSELSERMESFALVGVELFRDSWNESDQSFFVTVNCFDQSQIVFVDATFDSDPLVFLEPLFLDDFAAFHNLGHFVDWDHCYRSLVYTTQSLKHFLYMLRFICFTVDYTGCQLGLKNFEHV